MPVEPDVLHTDTHTHTHNHFTALWIFLGTNRVSWHQKKHSPTYTYYDPWHHSSSIHVPDSLFPQSLSKFSLVYLLAWQPPLHTPYISSSNHCLLFATHVHTIATCFAVVPRLCHLILVTLSTFYFEVSCYLTPHIHLNILISAC